MRRKSSQVMYRLLGVTKPLLGFFVLAVVLGVLGNLAAIAIPVIGSIGALSIFTSKIGISMVTVTVLLILSGVTRGLFRYGEQACNHYIAFKILAILRHKVFLKLRSLAPAKLEGKEKGNLISMITSDIELLEVFYAHTISPIAIAAIVSILMSIVIGLIHPVLGILVFLGYGIVGIYIPLKTTGDGGEIGQKYRDLYGKLNGYYLDNIGGIQEILQFDVGKERMEQMKERTDALEHLNEKLKKHEGRNRSITDSLMLGITISIFCVGMFLVTKGQLSFEGWILSMVATMSSFGPVIALSNLSNNLFHTIASGNRLLDLLEEKPQIEEIEGLVDPFTPSEFEEIKGEGVSFGYRNQKVLEKMSFAVKKGEVLGIHGESGCGKSTLLKLCMRFFEVESGSIGINNQELKNINTKTLRNTQSYMTQETVLFHSSIEENIKVANHRATREQVVEAAKKAAIHDFIMTLPDTYDTNVGELGSHLSSGERQRIGLARVFLHDAPLILLDEPTSNLDSLNEAMILSTIKQEMKEKAILLVSHRASTMNIANRVVSFKKH